MQVPRQYLVNPKSLGEGSLSQRTPCTWKDYFWTYFQDEPYIKKSLYRIQRRTYTKQWVLQNQRLTGKNTGFDTGMTDWASSEKSICTNKTIPRGVQAGTCTNCQYQTPQLKICCLGPMGESTTVSEKRFFKNIFIWLHRVIVAACGI